MVGAEKSRMGVFSVLLEYPLKSAWVFPDQRLVRLTHAQDLHRPEEVSNGDQSLGPLGRRKSETGET